MNKNPLSIIVPIALIFVFLIAGCDKETRLTRRLTGEWNLDRVEIQVYEDDSLISTTHSDSAGYFRLDEEGTGAFFPSDSTSQDSILVDSWANTEDMVMLEMGGKAYSMEVLEDKFRSQIWFYTQFESNTGHTNTEQIAWYLSKK